MDHFHCSQYPQFTMYIADIGTKTLSRQCLFYLLHECGLVHGADFSTVGEREFAVVNEKLIGQQLKKVAKAILKMGLAMGISEGLGPTGAMAQQRGDAEMVSKSSIRFVMACAFFCICFFMVLAVCWRKLRAMVQGFEREMRCLESELQSVQEQIADHHEYAGNLGNRLDAMDVRCKNIKTSMDAQAANLATIETHGRIDEAIDCVRYGLMELGGFVRNTLFTQERANLVIWNLGNRAETTDAQTSDPMDNGEETEEERPRHDAVIEPDSHASLDRAEALLENMRRDQNVALANGRWIDASQILIAISVLLYATACDDPEGLSVRVVRDIRSVFQRLSGRTRNVAQMKGWRDSEPMLKT